MSKYPFDVWTTEDIGDIYKGSNISVEKETATKYTGLWSSRAGTYRVTVPKDKCTKEDKSVGKLADAHFKIGQHNKDKIRNNIDNLLGDSPKPPDIPDVFVVQVYGENLDALYPGVWKEMPKVPMDYLKKLYGPGNKYYIIQYTATGFIITRDGKPVTADQIHIELQEGYGAYEWFQSRQIWPESWVIDAYGDLFIADENDSIWRPPDNYKAITGAKIVEEGTIE